MGKWKSSYNKTRVYNTDWEEVYPWLTWYKNACYCKWCERTLSSMRKSNFDQHEKSAIHLKNSTSSVSLSRASRIENGKIEVREFEYDCSFNETEERPPLGGQECPPVSVFFADGSSVCHNATPVASVAPTPAAPCSSTLLKNKNGQFVSRHRECLTFNEECDIFGRYVSSHLKKLPVEEMLQAQVEIQQLLIQKRLVEVQTEPPPQVML